jgi:hypothetical protein
LRVEHFQGSAAGIDLIVMREIEEAFENAEPVSALHQFDADPVWRGDVTQAAAVDAGYQLDRKTDAFAAQLGAKCLEIALVEEAEMIGPPMCCDW